jgi:hypothetical protein
VADLFQIIDDIDADKQAMVIKRLEDRAQMPKCNPGELLRQNWIVPDWTHT